MQMWQTEGIAKSINEKQLSLTVRSSARKRSNEEAIMFSNLKLQFFTLLAVIVTIFVVSFLENVVLSDKPWEISVRFGPVQTLEQGNR
jgi:hypothetical protein